MADTQTEEIPSHLAADTFWVTAYRRYYRLWFTLARSSHVSDDDAKDIVHGVIASILVEGDHRFESLEHVRNYIAKAILNRVILLKHQNKKRVPICDTVDALTEFAPELMQVERTEESRIIREAMLGLREKDFEIIKLRFFAGLTFSEISEFMGKPISTLKSREASALRKIAKALRKSGLEFL